MSTGRRNPQRGAELEREAVKMAKDYGLQAKRWDISGAADERGDIEIEGVFYGCKRKVRIPQYLKPEKQEAGVIIRGDRDIPRIVVPLKDWLGKLQYIGFLREQVDILDNELIEIEEAI